MKIYNGLGKENMNFEEAMELVRENLAKQDEYVMNVLFDILMEEGDNDVSINNTAIHNRS